MAPLLIPDHLRQSHFTGMNRYLRTGESHVIGRHVEIEALRADRGLVPVELSISEIRLAGEHLFTAFLRDITERRSFQQQLAEAERRRANLARYFSPKMVERLMQQDGRLDAVRLPNVAVLFADMIGFGAISRFAPGEETIQLLREFHALIAQAVFEHEGSLDKYMGDGLMATFPRGGIARCLQRDRLRSGHGSSGGGLEPATASARPAGGTGRNRLALRRGHPR
jgi:class 3 adenylate cyclase